MAFENRKFDVAERIAQKYICGHFMRGSTCQVRPVYFVVQQAILQQTHFRKMILR